MAGGLSCGATCAKYTLFLFNFVFFLVGAALLAVGIYVKVDSETNELLEVLDLAGESDLLHTAAILVIIVGALIFIVGFFGCCGACQESTCMLFIYALLVGLVLLLQIVCAILAAVFKGKLGEEIRVSMNETVQHDLTNNPEDAATRAWWSMQYNLKCCGSNGPEDYKGSNFTEENPDLHVPYTCCKLENDDYKNPVAENPVNCQNEAAAYDPRNPVDTTDLYTEGCYYELKDYLEEKAIIIIGIAVGLAVVQLIGIILACCLRKEISQTERTV